MLKLSVLVFALICIIQVIYCQEQKSNFETHVDTNTNSLDGAPGKISTLLDDIKNKQNGEFLRKFLAKLRQSTLIKDKFKNLLTDGQNQFENDLKYRSTDQEEVDGVDDSDENDNEITEQPIQDDYVEDKSDSEEINDVHDSYAYDEFVNPDAVDVDHYDYPNSKETSNESDEIPMADGFKTNNENDEDALVKELKNMKSKFPFRTRRSVDRKH